MDRLSFFLAAMAWTIISGGFIILALTFGWYGWTPIWMGAILGVVLGYPCAFLASRYIKAKDPHWDERGIENAKRPFFDPGRPEV